MFNKKRVISAFIALAVLVTSVSVNVLAKEHSNLYTQVDKSDGNTSVNFNTDGYRQVAANENLALYVREETASLRIVDLESGYVWGALAEDDPENLNDSWASFGNSIVSIMYYDNTGNSTQIGAGHKSAECTFKYEENTIICQASFKEQDIYLEAKVELKEDHVLFSVDDTTIREEGKYVIGQVYFSPFLGSTVGDTVDGYMFVPDGSGALIRFRQPTKYLTGYNQRVFGSDYAIDNLFEIGDLKGKRTNDFLKDEEKITMPVYGVSHGNENALFGHIEHGAEYAGIVGEPAGITTDYNYSTAYFIYRQLYQQPTSRDGGGIQIVQEDSNAVNPQLAVYFLHDEDANYSGMARTYRKILEQDGILPNYGDTNGGLQLDFIAADIKDGFLFDTTKKLTEIEDVENAAEQLNAAGITDVDFSLLGWQPKGLHGYSKIKTYKKSVMGSLQEIAQLQTTLEEKGNHLSLYIAPLSAKETQTGSKRNIGITRSQSVIEVKRPNEEVYLGSTFYMKTKEALKLLQKQATILKDAGVTDIVLDDIGSVLYGEYFEDEFYTRSEVQQMVQETAADLAGEEGLTLYQPAEYMLSQTAVYRDVPMSSGRYIFETDSVPFIQLVLSGSLTMYAPYANQSFYRQADILRCIEYNAWPSFILTGSDSESLKKTVSEELFSTYFGDWKDIIIDYYNQVSDVLSHVTGQQMVSHTVVADAVVRVAYETGAVYVNYQNDSVTVDGIELAAESAVYVEY